MIIELKDPVFKRISLIVSRENTKAYLIGGYVRDTLMGRPSKDIDIVVLGSGIDLAKRLANEIGKPSISFNKEFRGARAQRRTTSTGLPNRRVSNARFKTLCDWQPSFPSYREGYADILRKG